MKNYIALLLSCTFACAQAMMEESYPTIYLPIVDKDDKQISSTLIELTPTLSWYDIQDMLREKLGPGNIKVGPFLNPGIGERAEQIREYKESLSKLVELMEKYPIMKDNWDRLNYRFILNQ
jgi:hypothetical protein